MYQTKFAIGEIIPRLRLCGQFNFVYSVIP